MRLPQTKAGEAVEIVSIHARSIRVPYLSSSRRGAPELLVASATIARLRLPPVSGQPLDGGTQMGLYKGKTEGGAGGKRGHSNMDHWVTTEEIKESTRKRRRLEAKQDVRAAAGGDDAVREMEAGRISVEKMSLILVEQLAECDLVERALFDSISVPPERVQFADSVDDAFVVARRGADVIYYEESEDGFNTSRLDATGRIADHWYNQDELRWVLYAWARS